MNDTGTTLDDLRRDIDSIDAEMHALIIRRAEVRLRAESSGVEEYRATLRRIVESAPVWVRIFMPASTGVVQEAG